MAPLQQLRLETALQQGKEELHAVDLQAVWMCTNPEVGLEGDMALPLQHWLDLSA